MRGMGPDSDHTHECRDCGVEIDCFDTEESCDWPGGNYGCMNTECRVSA